MDYRETLNLPRTEFPMRANPEQRVVLVIEVQRARYTVLPFSHTPRITGGVRPSQA